MASQSRSVKIGAGSRKTALPTGIDTLLLRDTELTGFTLRIRQTGGRYMIRGFVAGSGIRRNITLGDSVSLTAAQAREMAMGIRNQFRLGIDPVLEAQATAKAAAQADGPTLTEVAATYLEEWRTGRLGRQKRPPRPRSVIAHEIDAKRALKALCGLSAAAIDHGAVRRFMGQLRSEAVSTSTKRRAFGALSVILQFAVREGVIDSNSCRLFDMPAGSESRDHYLTQKELAAVWQTCDGLHQFGRLVRFLIAQPVRLNIARELDWGDVDLDEAILTIRATATGNILGFPAAVVLTYDKLDEQVISAKSNRLLAEKNVAIERLDKLQDINTKIYRLQSQGNDRAALAMIQGKRDQIARLTDEVYTTWAEQPDMLSRLGTYALAEALLLEKRADDALAVSQSVDTSALGPIDRIDQLILNARLQFALGPAQDMEAARDHLRAAMQILPEIERQFQQFEMMAKVATMRLSNEALQEVSDTLRGAGSHGRLRPRAPP